MIIAVDFDGVITRDRWPTRPLVLRDGAADALQAIKAAGHILVLHSWRWGDLGTPEMQVECEAFLRAHGLWSLFDRVWHDPGKPYADVYLDHRALAVGDDGDPTRPSWRDVAAQYGDGEHAHHLPWDGDGAPPRLVAWLREGPVTIWLVDGSTIRDHAPVYSGAWRIYERETDETWRATDWSRGGHGGRHPWIPWDEIWVEWSLGPEEWGPAAVHEAVERYWMIWAGKPHEQAHEIATRIEQRVRLGEQRHDEALARALMAG